MPKHRHSADIEYLWALARITKPFVRISALLALGRHSPSAVAGSLCEASSAPILPVFLLLAVGSLGPPLCHGISPPNTFPLFYHDLIFSVQPSVDNPYMYRGSAGGEIALLLERLIYRLGISKERVQFSLVISDISLVHQTIIFI